MTGGDLRSPIRHQAVLVGRLQLQAVLNLRSKERRPHTELECVCVLFEATLYTVSAALERFYSQNQLITGNLSPVQNSSSSFGSEIFHSQVGDRSFYS